MRIFVTGTRGIPNIPGGVETHCEHLYPLIAAQGNEVYVARRSSYVQDSLESWNNIDLVDCYSPRRKSLEAIVHTFIALLQARFVIKPDIVHLHAVGPALLTPFARILGLKVVFTHHGEDYNRAKWGRFAKFALLAGERFGGLFANEVIVISRVIHDIVQKKCKRSSTVIPNGVNIPATGSDTEYLVENNINPGRYILSVARFVPEKGLSDLIQAYSRLSTDYQLVICGDADYESEYSKNLRQLAREDKKIILTGYVTGKKLEQIFQNAGLFVLPSYHEGLPIALLEAMSYGLPVLVSDIPAHCEIGLPEKRYFRTGSIENLQEKLGELLDTPWTTVEREQQLCLVKTTYNWQAIAEQTIAVYQKLLQRGKTSSQNG